MRAPYEEEDVEGEEVHSPNERKIRAFARQNGLMSCVGHHDRRHERMKTDEVL